MRLKNLLLQPLALRPVRRLFTHALGDAMPIFMGHRFEQPDLNIVGHSPDSLRRDLAFLRREGFQLVSLRALTDPAANERPASGPCVVFTVDDGYSDFLDVALPIFAEFDCPVTVFLSTGIVSGELWYWWDKVTYAFSHSQRASVTIPINGSDKVFHLDTPASRARASDNLIEQLKAVPDAERVEHIENLGAMLDVDVPRNPPPSYRVMTWRDVETCASTGVATFGPHTVTHPVLPNTTAAQARAEIIGSWVELQERCSSIVPVFAYPTGAWSERDVAILRESGMAGALTTETRYSTRSPFTASDTASRFIVPRFAYPEDSDESRQFMQVAIGVERVKSALRASVSRR